MGSIQTRTYHIQVDFTKSGRRQFDEMNRQLGDRLIMGSVLRSELSEYIGAHYASGKNLDYVCQQVRYENGIYLLLKQIGDTWFITDIWCEDAPIGFTPYYLWQRIKRGCSYILRQVMIGWQEITASMRWVVTA